MLLLRLSLLLVLSLPVFAQEECCHEECEQQEEPCCRRRCRPRYNPEEEELYRQRTDASYPSQREGMFETMTHQ